MNYINEVGLDVYQGEIKNIDNEDVIHRDITENEP